MRVLGVDPGSRYTGYGIVERSDGRLRHVASGRINASRGDSFADRLDIIYRGLTKVLQDFDCEVAAVEGLFTARNAMSSIKLGHARGVALLVLQHSEMVISEYAPAKVKKTVAGNGRASKDDVQMIVKRLLGVRGDLSSDASDALAIAICHCHSLDFKDRLQPSRS
jgi:crossover junction endodeoxyribonuclease RuvC